MLGSSVFNEKEIYQEIVSRIDAKTDKGIFAHRKHIEYVPGMKEYVIMYRWIDLDTVIELRSESFETELEAKHFSECFNDSFLADSVYLEENGKYYVYSGWMIKHTMMTYSWRSKGQYFEFANWS